MTHLAVVMFTYDRWEYAVRTLRSTLDRARFGGVVSVHIADDGSGRDYQQGLVEIAAGYPQVALVTLSDSGRKGYGASYNLASQQVHQRADFVLALEDDWELQRDLDLDELARAIMESDGASRFECVRLGYIGYTQELRGRFVYAAGQQFLLLDPDSPERHVAAGHPRLETVAFERRVGPWTEGLNAGATEFDWCGRPESRVGVVWPLDLGMSASQSGRSLYAHIGAIQARTDQAAVPTATDGGTS